METRTDAELAGLSRDGDREVFGELACRYGPAAGRLARRLVRREDLAQEVVQESLVQAWLSLNKLRDPARFRSWLYGIVLNIGRGYLRERVGISLDAVLEGLQPSSIVTFETPERLAERDEQSGLVLEAVMSLSPVDRDLLLLFYWAELSLAEIAVMRGKSAGTVKVGLHRARQRLKTCLIVRHPEIIPVKRRRQTMIEVTIADIVKQEFTGEDGKKKPMCVLVLLDKSGQRFLPIWVAEREGQAIASGLRDFSFPRPMTHDFLIDLLETVKAVVEEVRVESLKGDTFYGVVKLRDGKKDLEMDARPSDAIALAVRAGKPIFVAEDVMERLGQPVPEGKKLKGRGVDAIMEGLSREVAEYHQRPKVPEAELYKKAEELYRTLFQ